MVFPDDEVGSVDELVAVGVAVSKGRYISSTDVRPKAKACPNADGYTNRYTDPDAYTYCSAALGLVFG